MIDVSSNYMIFCTGCGACKNICPTKAISMEADAEGFLFPRINSALCIKCDKCEAVCQIADRRGSVVRNPAMFAAVTRDTEALMRSSSGGAFAALADIAAQRDGYIIGCLFNESMKPVHRLVKASEGYTQFHGSKYVQSDIGDTYRQTEDCLKNGAFVLFTGTPCQIRGLQLFLKKDYENLLTADLICHGVPSPKLWQEHIAYLERKGKKQIVSYRFRGKYRVGWSLYYYYYYYKGCKRPRHGYATLDPFYTSFLKAENYRECCYRCKLATLPRVGDITIGDYWGVEKHHPKLNPQNGVSLILLNTEKALKLLGAIEQRMYLIPTKTEWAIEENHNLVMPTRRPKRRDTFYLDVLKDVDVWEKSFYHNPQYVKSLVKSKIPPSVKKLIKKWLLRR